jgi:hypothetical protein
MGQRQPVLRWLAPTTPGCTRNPESVGNCREWDDGRRLAVAGRTRTHRWSDRVHCAYSLPEDVSWVTLFRSILVHCHPLSTSSRPTDLPLIQESATQSSTPERIAQQDALVRRILASSAFLSSRKLQEFLRYIVDCAHRNALEELTEQHIGMAVFRRQAGFNSGEDSIVRSQARLLRQRLSAYFQKEGVSEPLLLEIPRGHYVPIFTQARESPSPAEDSESEVAAVPAAPPAPAEVVQPGKPQDRYPIFLGILLLVCGVLSAVLGWQITHIRTGKLSAAAAPLLWRPFVTSQDPPLVIYSNAVFVGNGAEGLRYANEQQAQGVAIMDHYTGTGEVAAVYEITRLFDGYGANFVLKRSRLVTWDEARSRNLIFIGAPVENPSLKLLPDSGDFSFVPSGDNFDLIDRHPLPGEPERMPHSDTPLTFDYAIIAVRAAPENDHRILVFSGLTTLGTQAAVEFACKSENVGLLNPTLSSSGQLQPFEAVLKTTIQAGVPVETNLIALHRH